jgi:hypothetical protein
MDYSLAKEKNCPIFAGYVLPDWFKISGAKEFQA